MELLSKFEKKVVCKITKFFLLFGTVYEIKFSI